jgi:hypothetical protein
MDHIRKKLTGIGLSSRLRVKGMQNGLSSRLLPPLYERDGKGDTGDYIEDEEEYNCSDEYEEDNDDDDDDAADDDSSDDEEYENLEMRIESFIAKVYEQRRKESLLESRGTQL